MSALLRARSKAHSPLKEILRAPTVAGILARGSRRRPSRQAAHQKLCVQTVVSP